MGLSSGCIVLHGGAVANAFSQGQRLVLRHRSHGTGMSYMGSLRLTMPEFIDRLSEFCEARMAQQHANHRNIVDYQLSRGQTPRC